MDFIKNKQKLIDLTNKLINNCGEARTVAKMVDEVIFDYFRALCNGNECVCTHDYEIISTLQEIRDLFWQLETN